ncbi:DUF6036 family nucleotidyltransferase [Devriesea agamarum]|uniref:DUF6036 family nucleotidyltransferase n=1 Tax=Devriesea agamarum TaxID=472569 RepID=UPI0018D288B4|nr:DUF6036 family nucleotidyltransferase [Devriesea agamarum]
MNRTGGSLGAGELRELLTALSERLAERGVQAQLFVVGGAAMALAYDNTRLTRDVDALFVPTPEVREVAADLGVERGLDEDWLNDAAKGFMPGSDSAPKTVFRSDSLVIQVPSPEYLLAMKLYASRGDRDIDDAARLFNLAGYTEADEAVALLGRMYPSSMLLPRHRYITEEVASRAAQIRPAAQASTPRADLDVVSPVSPPSPSTDGPRM